MLDDMSEISVKIIPAIFFLAIQKVRLEIVAGY